MWEFKYAPEKFEDLILNSDIKKSLKEAFETRPSLILYGEPGTGKGSFVNVLINHYNLKSNTLHINASDETGIDVIRDKVKSFANSISLNQKKLVFFNESDALSAGQSGAQKMLKELMETTAKNTQYIFACNEINYMTDALLSRCQLFKLSDPPAKEIFDKLCFILDSEKIKYNKKSVIEIIEQTYPDIRQSIIILKQNVVKNTLSTKIKTSASNDIFNRILKTIKIGDPEKIRSILKTYPINYSQLYNYLYKQLMEQDNIFKNDAEAILLIGEHCYRNSIVAIPEINFMHMVFKFIANGVI